jgi:GntR family transcriptional regulator
MFNIYTDSPMPIYAQLEQAVKLALISGKIQEGEQMPTVRQLAVTLKINANTVARVYTELERQKILETRRGIGTFVSIRNTEQDFEEKTRKDLLVDIAIKFLNEASESGYSPKEIIEVIRELSEKGKK